MNQNLYDHILIRYGELSLKKSNRKQFTQKVQLLFNQRREDVL